nr:YkgJ family cysteine cluster protein [uncultured Methanoregula sp.]
MKRNLMKPAPDIPLPYQIVALMQERNRLFAFPLERLAIEVKKTRFRCDCCGKCCTRAVNPHIFLLDHDVTEVKKIDPAALEPAPDPEFCDQNGMLYVSGYALKMRNDGIGSCWFLKNGKCKIYDRRFSGCRMYPHMLRRSADTPEQVVWKQFAHKNEHGRYDQTPSPEECLLIAREIKEYENAFLNQQISFLETIHEYFTLCDLMHDPGVYQQRMQEYCLGRPVGIKVFDQGELIEYRITRTE